MPKQKSAAGRELIVSKLAARAQMTIDEWTGHLHLQELGRLKREEPGAYDEIWSKRSWLICLRTWEAAAGKITTPPSKTCTVCNEEKVAPSFSRGQNVCKKCKIEEERQRVDVLLDGEKKRAAV